MNDELKPCPFCKSTDVQIVELETTYHEAYCFDCGAVGSKAKTVEGAIEQWNTRPIEDDMRRKNDMKKVVILHVEWAGQDRTCPACGNHYEEGHDDLCILA